MGGDSSVSKNLKVVDYLQAGRVHSVGSQLTVGINILHIDKSSSSVLTKLLNNIADIFLRCIDVRVGVRSQALSAHLWETISDRIG